MTLEPKLWQINYSKAIKVRTSYIRIRNGIYFVYLDLVDFTKSRIYACFHAYIRLRYIMYGLRSAVWEYNWGPAGLDPVTGARKRNELS